MALRFFFELTVDGLGTLFLLEFDYDREWDRYEMNVYCGGAPVGYCHGYGNKGWNPQVNNIWVTESLRRRGIATIMLSKVEDYFSHLPFPGTKIADNQAARSFWRSYLSERKSLGGRRPRARSA